MVAIHGGHCLRDESELLRRIIIACGGNLILALKRNKTRLKKIITGKPLETCSINNLSPITLSFRAGFCIS